MNNYLHFFKETRYEVVEGVDLVTPLRTLRFPILTTLQFGNSRFMCAFNCSLFLKPINCLVGIQNRDNQTLNNLPFR